MCRQKTKEEKEEKSVFATIEEPCLAAGTTTTTAADTILQFFTPLLIFSNETAKNWNWIDWHAKKYK